jgi:hypothetical protein
MPGKHHRNRDGDNAGLPGRNERPGREQNIVLELGAKRPDDAVGQRLDADPALRQEAENRAHADQRGIVGNFGVSPRIVAPIPARDIANNSQTMAGRSTDHNRASRATRKLHTSVSRVSATLQMTYPDSTKNTTTA